MHVDFRAGPRPLIVDTASRGVLFAPRLQDCRPPMSASDSTEHTLLLLLGAMHSRIVLENQTIGAFLLERFANRKKK